MAKPLFTYMYLVRLEKNKLKVRLIWKLKVRSSWRN